MFQKGDVRRMIAKKIIYSSLMQQFGYQIICVTAAVFHQAQHLRNYLQIPLYFVRKPGDKSLIS